MHTQDTEGAQTPPPLHTGDASSPTLSGHVGGTPSAPGGPGVTFLSAPPRHWGAVFLRDLSLPVSGGEGGADTSEPDNQGSESEILG